MLEIIYKLFIMIDFCFKWSYYEDLVILFWNKRYKGVDFSQLIKQNLEIF